MKINGNSESGIIENCHKLQSQKLFYFIQNINFNFLLGIFSFNLI